MTIEKLQDTVKPLDEVNKINELVDVCNIPMSYSATNPALTPSSGICTWVVTHNLGSENIFSIVYNSNNSEIFKNTSIDSANQITITFNSTDNIEAGSYRVVVTTGGIGTGSGGGSSYSLPTASTSVLGGVKIDGTSITIDGEGVISSVSDTYTLPVATTSTLGGVKIDGTSITIDGEGVISSTIDSTLSSTSTNPVQNSVIYPSLSGYLPANTTITVASSGGDYTSLNGAIAALAGKWSNGSITIQIDSGTFTLNKTLTFPDNNIPYIIIQGNSITNTVIEYDNNEQDMAIYLNGAQSKNTNKIKLQNLSLKNNNNTNQGIVLASGASLYCEDIKFVNFTSWSMGINSGSSVICMGDIIIDSTLAGDRAIIVNNSDLFLCLTTLSDFSTKGCNLNITNYTSGLVLYHGALIRARNCNYTINQVSNRYNITRNTITDSGVILGTFIES